MHCVIRKEKTNRGVGFEYATTVCCRRRQASLFVAEAHALLTTDCKSAQPPRMNGYNFLASGHTERRHINLKGV